MGAVNWERWARAAGAGFVVLAIAAFIVGGEAPKVGDSTDDLVSYYDGDRGQVFVSSLLFAFALLLFLWFAAAIANSLRESGEGRVGEVKGWLRVDAESVSTKRALEPWAIQSVAFARALPPKEKK